MSWESSNSIQQRPEDDCGGFCGLFPSSKKPVEIYVFIDPLCEDCWSLEPFLKKLTMEYGQYFTLRPILTGDYQPLVRERNECSYPKTVLQPDNILLNNAVSFPWRTSLAIKAAELQGRKAGTRFLRTIQEALFLNKQDITADEILIECAKIAKLDLEEFREDMYSASAKKAFQCDVKLSKELEIDESPSIVFFNESEEDSGIKISGLYSYDVYVNVLHQMLQIDPQPAAKPPVEEFLSSYKFVGSREISLIYDWTNAQTEKEMKKLQLKQMVERIPIKHDTFWKYNITSKAE
ncbi:dithiol-disulfide isomerase [Virgibacillus sp. 7505]|uniref:ClpXP adapter SpxH family protein n=1 Tax=Bacillaceae TaxID=186817 RepID=UPI000BA795CE|nr:ClpXP adapter SpxH family protein [Virgibacillus sp. 7505]PAE15796.1 dithiol-disulfide isomerase [Virgibacillus sp. 7505]